MSWQLLADCTVISLLAFTIYACWRLNNRIVELRTSRNDLIKLITTFDSAIKTTNENVLELRILSERSSSELQQYISKANELISDLGYLNQAASAHAEKLERHIKAIRQLQAQNALSNVMNSIDNIPAANANHTHLSEAKENKDVANSKSNSYTQPINKFSAIKASIARTKDEFLSVIRERGKR